MLRSIPLLAAGFSIKVNNGKVIVSPKENLNEETRLYIKEFKNEIITELEEQAKVKLYFDAFIDHLMRSKGSCCYAPANRYCTIGSALKAKYEDSYSAL